MQKSLLDANHVLVLQGGGALGAYQAGAFEKLAGVGYRPEYVAGISIGAINAALIAGNTPENRVARLHAFWDMATSGNPIGDYFGTLMEPFIERKHMNMASANQVMFTGIPGFFTLRYPPPLPYLPGSSEACSFYDTAPLRETLLNLVDFDYINAKKVRFAVGAVNVTTGNLIYFDNHKQKIGPEHVMASGALPPGFPPVEIDGEFYWDGGLVSNTPLQYVLDNHDESEDTVIFQFDLFNARGAVPRSIMDIESREKDIRFSSRTRYTTDRVADLIKVRTAMHRLYKQLPQALKDSKDVQTLMRASHPGKITIIHLIYRQAEYELSSKDYEFSRRSMHDHWRSGVSDVERTIANREWIERKCAEQDLVVIDGTRELDVSDRTGAFKEAK